MGSKTSHPLNTGGPPFGTAGPSSTAEAGFKWMAAAGYPAIAGVNTTAVAATADLSCAATCPEGLVLLGSTLWVSTRQTGPWLACRHRHQPQLSWGTPEVTKA
jgi:hypothetical protein